MFYTVFVLQRSGADYAVYVNTAQEFDGCDSGASPDEAVSWGKLSLEAKYVKVLHNTFSNEMDSRFSDKGFHERNFSPLCF